MIIQRSAGMYETLSERELLVLLGALCMAQEHAADRKLREEIMALEVKLFGENTTLIHKIQELIK